MMPRLHTPDLETVPESSFVFSVRFNDGALWFMISAVVSDQVVSWCQVPMSCRILITNALLTICCCVLPGADNPAPGDFHTWSLQKALFILTKSPWARQETYTSIIGGIGSGISGEKEIYSTFFVRFLSARPIREAYARVRQIQADYDKLSPQDRREVDRTLEPGLNLDSSRWIVVTLAFRSNDSSMELRVRQFLEMQTTVTMKPRAYLSSAKFPQIGLAAYFPPKEDEVGARFVFPRSVEGTPVISAGDAAVVFELEVPGFSPTLRSKFPVPEMRINGQPVI